MEDVSKFYTLLRVPPLPEPRRYARLQVRICALGETHKCTACNGTGHYSHPGAPGASGPCYRCHGWGIKHVPLTADLYKRLTIKVESGQLDAYLATLRKSS